MFEDGTDPEFRGRCVSCGFLAKRDQHFADTEILSVSTAERRDGTLWLNEGRLVRVPFCTVWQFDLPKEIATKRVGKDMTGEELNRLHLEILSRDRHCKRWVEWQEELTPKEHRDKYEMLVLEQQRRDFELELYTMSEKSQQRNRKVDLTLAAVGLLLALMQVLTASEDAIIFKIVPWLGERIGQ